MEPDELRAEIELRKKRAKDSKIREILWDLYIHRVRYERLILQDPQRICPEVNVSFKVSDKCVEFTVGQTVYHLIYKEGPHSNRKGYGDEDEEIVPATLGLRVDDQRVFKSEISRSTRYLDDGPVWKDRLEDITRFIEGPWLSAVIDLWGRIQAYQKEVWKQQETSRLEAQKKRFGL